MIAIKRNETLHSNPAPDMTYAVGDIVYLVGTLQQLNKALCLFDPGTISAQQGLDALSQSTIVNLGSLTRSKSAEST